MASAQNLRPALSKKTVLAPVVKRKKTEAPEEETASPAPSLVKRMKTEVQEEETTSPAPSFKVSRDVDCDICTETKLKAIKSCLVCLASYCESHIQTHYTSAALKRHKLVNPSPHLLDQICPQHDKLLELYCVQDQQLICMQCALINHQNHSTTSPAAARQKIQVQLKGRQDDLQNKVHQLEIKVQDIRQAVKSHKSSAEAAVKHCEKLFDDLIRSMAERQAETTKMIRAQEKAEVTAVEEITMKLKQEISDLKKRHEELEQLSQREDDFCFIQNFSSLSCYQGSDLFNISISPHLTFEEIETVVSELKSQLDHLCDQDIVRISEKAPTVHVTVNCEKDRKMTYLPSQPKTRKEFLMYSSDLNLNRASDCSELFVSDKSVSWNGYGYGYGYTHEHYQVLCKEKQSGRCYFEVEWQGTDCSLVFSHEQNDSPICESNNRPWKCGFPTASLCVQHNDQDTDTYLVSKIGVFLDQTAGSVSFYSVSDNMTLLQRNHITFTEPVYPGFAFKNCQNHSSVKICDLTKLKE